jgi:5-methylcytosine-specific restriction endonuclease McrA
MDKCQNCKSVLPARPLGKLGRNQLFCNALCGKLFRGEIRFVEKPANCLFCNIALVVVGDRAGRPKKYCCNKHADQYNKSLKPKAPKLKKCCEWCNTEFDTARKDMKFCKETCRIAAQRDKDIKATLAKHDANPRRFDFDCERCGQVVTTDKHVTRGAYGRYCRSCALVKRRERYRIKTANRQKIMNPIRISADVIIKRDGNVCHLCDVEIDLTLARNSRFGATIDHVIPVSKGGADTLENMRLAHWICNIKKGNRVDA